MTQKWTTSEELAFVKGLGTFNEKSGQRDRTFWLTAYLVAAEKRVHWGKIDGAEVCEAVRTELKERREDG